MTGSVTVTETGGDRGHLRPLAPGQPQGRPRRTRRRPRGDRNRTICNLPATKRL